MAINNPYVPGDPYSYDLKWLVAKVKEILQQLGTLNEAIEKKIFDGFLEHSIVQFHNVADMLAADMKDGSIVLTLGYYEPGDYGALFYLIKDFNPGQCSLSYFLTMDNNSQIAIPLFVYPYVTPEMFGAKGDGTTDDRVAIQMAIDFGQNVILTKTYGVGLIDRPDASTYTVVALEMDNDTTLDFQSGGTIKLLDNTRDGYVIVLSEGKKNITIKGGTIVGDRLTFSGTTTEFCHGMVFVGCENVYVENMNSKENRGDGITFGNELNKNVHVSGCNFNHNSRNGASVTNVDGFEISGCTFTNTDRTAPMYGIDFEPNMASQTLKNVRVSDCGFSGNGYGSIMVVSRANNDNVSITNCYCNGCVNVYAAGTGSAIKVSDCNIIAGTPAATTTEDAWYYYRGTCIAVGCSSGSSVTMTGLTMDMINLPNAPLMFKEEPGAEHYNISIDAVLCNGPAQRGSQNRNGNALHNCHVKYTRASNCVVDANTPLLPFLPNQNDPTNRFEIYGTAEWVANDAVCWTGNYYEIITGQNTNINVIQRASSEMIVKNVDSVQHNLMNATFRDVSGSTYTLLSVPAGTYRIIRYLPALDQILFF